MNTVEDLGIGTIIEKRYCGVNGLTVQKFKITNITKASVMYTFDFGEIRNEYGQQRTICRASHKVFNEWLRNENEVKYYIMPE